MVEEDRPIGGGGPSANGFDFASDPQAFASTSAAPVAEGPLEDRLASKSWKTKSDALDELMGLYKKATEKSDPLFSEHSAKFAKLLQDSHPTALEKAVDAVTILTKYSHQSKNYAPEWMKGLIEKGATAMKPVLKQKATEAVLTIAEESERFQDITKILVDSMAAKIPKTQAAAVNVASEMIHNFGISVVSPVPFLKKLEDLSTHSNAQIRNAVIGFYVECYCWMQESFKSMLTHLKPAQMNEVEKKFEEMKEPPKVKRFPASKRVEEELKLQQMEELKEAGKAPMEAPKPDLYSMAIEKNPWGSFTEDWIKQVSAIEAWMEKKNKIEELANACDVVKLSPDGMKGVLPGLRKLALQTNMNISGVAIKALSLIAKGTRLHFKQEAKALFVPISQKYKERKPALVAAVKDLFEAMKSCFDEGLNNIYEEVIQVLGDKNPTIKINTLKFAKEIAMTTYIDDLKDITPNFIPLFQKLVNDSATDVRDAALQCLGVFKARLGEQLLNAVLGDLNPSKMSKVDESAGEVKKSIFDKPRKVEEPPPPPPKKKRKQSVKVEATTQPPAGQGEALTFDMGEGLPAEPPKRLKKKRPEPKEEEKKEAPPPKAPTKSEAKPPVSAPKKPVINIDEELKGAGGPLPSKEEAEELASELFPSEVVSALNATAWKEKNTAIEAIAEWIPQDLEKAALNAETIVVLLKAKLKDFKESNLVLVKGWIGIVSKLAEMTNGLHKRTAAMVLHQLTEKLGDSKFKAVSDECLLNLSSVLGPGFIAKLIVKHGSEAKSPNVIKEACNFLTKLPMEFGSPSGLPLKEIIDFGKIAIAHSNPGARKSATEMLVGYFQWCGEAAKGLIVKDIKESTQKVLEAELAKVEPYAPNQFEAKRELRGHAAIEKQEESKSQGKKKGGGGGGGIASMLESALPRQDISGQLTKKVLKQFGESNWKSKKEVCEKVAGILEGAGNRILPTGLGDLINTLKGMLASESNKTVQKEVVKLIGKLGFAVGSSASKFAAKFYPRILDFLSNKAADVRNQVLGCMDHWGEAIGPESLFPYFPDRLRNESPELRCDLLAWMVTAVTKHEGLLNNPKIELKPFIPHLLACLGAKEPSVRGVSEKFVALVIPTIGTAPFSIVMKDLKPGVVKSIKPIIEKYSSLVTNTEPSESAGAPPSSSKLNKIKSASSFDDEPHSKSGLNLTPSRGKIKKQIAKPSIQNMNKTSTNFNTSPAGPKIPPHRGSSIGTGSKNGEQSKPGFYPILSTGNRDKRMDALRKCKFSMEEVRSDEVEKLRVLLKQTFGSVMESLLLHKDFKKQLEGAKALQILCETQSESEDVRDVTDIIVRWIYVRLIDHQSNTAVIKAIIELINSLILMFENHDYRFHDSEGKLLLASMIEKTGVNNIVFRKELKELIFRCTSSVYSHSRVMAHLLGGLASKNLKSTAESLDLIAQLIECYGISLVTPKDLKTVCRLLESSDTGVRNNSLNVLVEVYKRMREDIWANVGTLSSKQKDLMEARFKKLNLMGHSTSSNSLIGFGFTSGNDRSKSPNQKSGLRKALHGPKNSFTPRIEKLKAPSALANPGMSARALGKQFGQPQSSTLKNYNSVNELPDQNQPSAFQDQGRASSSSRPQFKSSIGSTQTLPKSGSQSRVQTNQYQSTTFTNRIPDMQFVDDRPQTSTGYYLAELQSSENQPASSVQAQQNSTMESIDIAINYLKFGEQPEKERALQSLTQIITLHDNKLYLQTNVNQMIEAFCAVMVYTFDRPLSQVPLPFARNFLSVVGKVANMHCVMNELDQDQLMNFEEQLLRKLLIDGLNQALGPLQSPNEPPEGEKIVKSLNTTMLRLLENCNQTRVFSSLLRLMKKYCADPSHPKMAGLIIKCLLKLTKVLDKLITELNVDKILLVIHEYLLAHPSHRHKGPGAPTNSNTELGTRIVKTIINELVKLKGARIWEHYSVVQMHPAKDTHIQRWIKIILTQPGAEQQKTASQVASQRPGNSNPRPNTSSICSAPSTPNISFSGIKQHGVSAEVQLDTMLHNLSPRAKNQDQIIKLQGFLTRHPQLDLDAHLQQRTEEFREWVHSSLQRYKIDLKSNYIMSDGEDGVLSERVNQPLLPRPWKKEEKSHQSTSQLPIYSTLGEKSGLDASNPLRTSEGGSATPTGSSLQQHKMHLSSLKARWQKQGGVSQSSSKAVLSTTIDGPGGIGVTRSHSGVTPDKKKGNDNLNLSFSALNQTAKKWADRRQARERSQELQNTSNPALLQSPPSRNDFEKEELQQTTTVEGFGGGETHKHHLSMTGYVGGFSKGTGSMQSGIPRRSAGQEHGKTLQDIKKKLQMMKMMHSSTNNE